MKRELIARYNNLNPGKQRYIDRLIENGLNLCEQDAKKELLKKSKVFGKN